MQWRRLGEEESATEMRNIEGIMQKILWKNYIEKRKFNDYFNIIIQIRLIQEITLNRENSRKKNESRDN